MRGQDGTFTDFFKGGLGIRADVVNWVSSAEWSIPHSRNGNAFCTFPLSPLTSPLPRGRGGTKK
jgi:hypothetical protein